MARPGFLNASSAAAVAVGTLKLLPAHHGVCLIRATGMVRAFPPVPSVCRSSQIQVLGSKGKFGNT